MKKIKPRPKKATDAFKEMMTVRDIVPALHFIGSAMLWPYTWNGERRYARIKLEKIVKSIEWDVEWPTE